MKNVEVITFVLALLPILFAIKKGLEKYKVVKMIDNTNIKEMIPANQSIPIFSNKIKPPKPQYERRSHTYSYDEHDTFYYEFLKSQSEEKELPVLIVCFMGGHSKSSCIRRMAAQMSKKHDVYILLPRGSLNTQIDPKQKKFRSEGYDTEDIETLVEMIGKCFIVGYSLGGLTLGHYLSSTKQTNVQKAFFAFTEHDPDHSAYVPMKVQKMLGFCLLPYLKNNKEYFINHGFTVEQIDEILQVGTVVHYDEVVWCYLEKMKNVHEYYNDVSLKQRLHKIQVPSLFFNTYDDIICGKTFLEEEIKQNKNINLVVINKGNHLGGILKDGTDMSSRIAEAFFEQ